MNTKFKILLAAALAVGSVVSLSAMADSLPVWPKTARDAKTFVQAMPPDVWMKITTASLQLKFFVGKPVVAIFNPYDEDLINVVCDGKWSLVGANAYDKSKGAPDTIPAHSVGFTPTDGFDGYCKQSIVGLTESGERHEAILSIPGDFTNSTAVFFKPNGQ